MTHGRKQKNPLQFRGLKIQNCQTPDPAHPSFVNTTEGKQVAGLNPVRNFREKFLTG